MPQSLFAVYVHLVFSTKERRAMLRDKRLRDELHAWLGGVSKQLDCPPIRIGGVDDHVHALARLGRTISQADWVKELKRVSSLWIKEQAASLHDFQWQAGYAIFSVSQSRLADVVAYIENQEAHHQRQTFQDEMRAFFRKYEVEYDERYVWD